MTLSLDEFLLPPSDARAPQPLRRPSQKQSVAAAVAAVLGVDADELIASGDRVVERELRVTSRDASPTTIAERAATASKFTISATHLTFRCTQDPQLRRVVIEIEGPSNDCDGAAGCLHGNVVRTVGCEAEGFLLTIRLTPGRPAAS